MKYIVFFSLFWYCICGISAQTPKYFTTSYSWGTNSHSNGFSIKILHSGGYVISGSVLDSLTYQWHAFLIKINTEGLFLNFTEYFAGNGASNCDMELLNNGFAMINYVNFDYTTSYYHKIDDNFEIIFESPIGPAPYTNVAYASCLGQNHNIFLAGEIQPYPEGYPNPPTHPYLIQLGENGAVLFDTIYYQYENPYAAFNAISPSPDGTYLATGWTNYWVQGGDVLLCKLDTAGNILQERIWDGGEVERGRDAEILPDGSVICAIDRVVLWPGLDYGGAMKFSADLEEVVWQNFNYFKEGYTRCISLMPNGDVVVGGAVNYSFQNLDAELVKLTPNGEFIRKVTYGSDEDDYIFDMMIDPEGTLLACGRTQGGTLGADVYFLKLNCMLLLTEPKADFSYSSQNNSNTVFFQNLSQYAYPDSIDGGHYLWDFGDGSPVFVADSSLHDTLSHSYATSGNYQVTLTAVVCSDTSVVRLAVQAGSEGAGTTPVVPIVLAPRREIRVFPNPATENINIAYRLEEGEVVTIKLFDSSGRLCMSQELSGSGVFVKNTSNLQPGLYFCEGILNGDILLRDKFAVVE